MRAWGGEKIGSSESNRMLYYLDETVNEEVLLVETIIYPPNHMTASVDGIKHLPKPNI